MRRDHQGAGAPCAESQPDAQQLQALMRSLEELKSLLVLLSHSGERILPRQPVPEGFGR